MRIFTTLFIICLLSLSAEAQKKEFGGFVGFANYQGDLVHAPFSFQGSGIDLGLVYKHYLTSRLAVRGGLAGGTFSGDDNNFEEARDRNFSFNTGFVEVTGALEYSFLRAGQVNTDGLFKSAISPFINVGVGLMFASPDASAPGRIPLVAADNDPPTTHFIVPIGVGIKYDISEIWSMSVELQHRTTFTDYLDGFSESANPDADDWLIFGGISVVKTLGMSAAKKFNLQD